MEGEARGLLERLEGVAQEVNDASLLLEAGFRIRHEELFAQARRCFGSWEAALAHLVVWIRDRELRAALDAATPAPEEEAQPEAEVSRSAHEDAALPLVASSTTGELLTISPEILPVTTAAWEPAPWPSSYGSLVWARCHRGPLDVVVFSSLGKYYTLLPSMMPHADALGEARSLRDWLSLDAQEELVDWLPRPAFQQPSARLVHVTVGGKAKATVCKDIEILAGRKGKEAFLCNEGDRPLAVFLDQPESGIFCASALGQGIHFAGSELRSMGRKSVGVNVMKLDGDQNAVVSAFVTDGVQEVAVVTAHGYGKRLTFDEFRRQGRAGAGMQVLRLASDDRVTAVAPCQQDDDLLLTTSTGRIWRTPAETFSLMGRSARGRRILELEDGETIRSLAALPNAGNPSLPPSTSDAPASDAPTSDASDSPAFSDAFGVSEAPDASSTPDASGPSGGGEAFGASESSVRLDSSGASSREEEPARAEKPDEPSGMF